MTIGEQGESTPVSVDFGVTGIGGSPAGTALNRRLDPDLLLLAFAALIVVVAGRMLTGFPFCTGAGEPTGTDAPGSVAVGRRLDLAGAGMLAAAGTGVGIFTGLFGVGGGFLAVSALTLLLGFAMPQAIGTSVLIITINCAVAVAARLGAGASLGASLSPSTPPPPSASSPAPGPRTASRHRQCSPGSRRCSAVDAVAALTSPHLSKAPKEAK